MKIIDLLNKIANGESLPKAINSKTGSISYYLYDKCGEECDDRNLYAILNDEIEIIEENKKIEKIKLYEPYPECEDTRFEEVENKINEIIDEINKMKEGK